MKTFKDKIINYKKQPDPSSWERILPIVEAQNNQGEFYKIKGHYRRLPKALLLLLLSLCVLGFYTFEKTKSKEGMISEVKKSNQQTVKDEKLVANEHSVKKTKKIAEVNEKVKSIPEVSFADKEKSNNVQDKSRTLNLFLTQILQLNHWITNIKIVKDLIHKITNKLLTKMKVRQMLK